MNSFTTMGAVMPQSFNLLSLSQTGTRQELASLSWPQPELGTAGANGEWSRGLSTLASKNTHRVRDSLVDGGSSKSIPAPAVAATAWKLTHPEFFLRVHQMQ